MEKRHLGENFITFPNQPDLCSLAIWGKITCAAPVGRNVWVLPHWDRSCNYYSMDKENREVRTPTKRKLYLILGPVNVENLPSQKERIISELTGLVKFSLSPGRNTKQLAPRAGLPIYVPSKVEEQKPKVEFVTRQGLMEKYAAKQRELAELERSVDAVKHSMMEIAIQMRQFETPEKAMPEFGQLRKKASSIFESPVKRDVGALRKKASSVFESPVKKEDLDFGLLRKKASSVFDNTLRKKASSVFEPGKPLFDTNLKTIVNDVKIHIDQQQQEFDQFANKTQKLVSNLWTQLSPKKVAVEADAVANTSMNIENLELGATSIIYEDEETDGEIDIDDADLDSLNSSI